MKLRRLKTMIALLLAAALVVPVLPPAAYADADTTYVWSLLSEEFTEDHDGMGVLRAESGKFYYLYGNDSNQLIVLTAESETGPWESLGSPGVHQGWYYDLAVYEGVPYVFYKDANQAGKGTVKYFDDELDDWVSLGVSGFTPNGILFAKIEVSVK